MSVKVMCPKCNGTHIRKIMVISLYAYVDINRDEFEPMDNAFEYDLSDLCDLDCLDCGEQFNKNG